MSRGAVETMPGTHERALEALARRGRLRQLAPRRGLDFASNDYLGLAEAPELKLAVEAALARGVAVGAGGSRLLRGNHPEHEALEAEAANYFRAERALYFGGGFMANYALFATLPARGDLIVHDALIHASARDGFAASKAEVREAGHNDADAFEDAIKGWRATGGKGRPWIAVESLYSMDGDCAPLADLVAIADRHDAMLVVDEAHATGAWGPDGRGLGAPFEGRENVVSLHTCGKALGVMGALATGSALLMDFMVNRARPFIYATAPSPLMAAAVRASLSLVRNEPARRQALHDLVVDAGVMLRQIPGAPSGGTQIVPVVVGSDQRAVALAAAMQVAGYDVRAVRPPTVPEGSARVRICLTLNNSRDETRAMFAVLARELERLSP